MVFFNNSDSSTGSSQVSPDESLGKLASVSLPAKTVFHALSKRERFRRITDLNRLYKFIVTNVDPKFSEDDFLAVFKQLGSMQLGKLIIGRKNNPNRFRWNYNLKEAASAALDNKPISELSTLPRKPRIRTKPSMLSRKKRRGPGRPKGSKNVKPTFTPYVESPAPEAVSVEGTKPSMVININIPPGANMQDVKALIDLAKGIGS